MQSPSFITTQGTQTLRRTASTRVRPTAAPNSPPPLPPEHCPIGAARHLDHVFRGTLVSLLFMPRLEAEPTRRLSVALAMQSRHLHLPFT